MQVDWSKVQYQLKLVQFSLWLDLTLFSPLVWIQRKIYLNILLSWNSIFIIFLCFVDPEEPVYLLSSASSCLLAFSTQNVTTKTKQCLWPLTLSKFTYFSLHSGHSQLTICIFLIFFSIARTLLDTCNPIALLSLVPQPPTHLVSNKILS